MAAIVIKQKADGEYYEWIRLIPLSPDQLKYYQRNDQTWCGSRSDATASKQHPVSKENVLLFKLKVSTLNLSRPLAMTSSMKEMQGMEECVKRSPLHPMKYS